MSVPRPEATELFSQLPGDLQGKVLEWLVELPKTTNQEQQQRSCLSSQSSNGMQHCASAVLLPIVCQLISPTINTTAPQDRLLMPLSNEKQNSASPLPMSTISTTLDITTLQDCFWVDHLPIQGKEHLPLARLSEKILQSTSRNTELWSRLAHSHFGVSLQSWMTLKTDLINNDSSCVCSAPHVYQWIWEQQYRLLQNGWSLLTPMHMNRQGETAVMWAIEQQDLRMLQLLLSLGCYNVNDRSSSILIRAAALGRLEIVEHLISRRCDVDLNIKDFTHRTPLIYAVKHGHLAVVRFLLKQSNVQINCEDGFGKTVLFQAILTGNIEMLQLLLSHPEMNVNDQNVKGNNVLAQHSCQPMKSRIEFSEFDDCERKHLEAMQFLLQHSEIDVNAQNKLAETPIFCAACTGNFELLKLLLQQPHANMNIKNTTGLTPLLAAAQNQNWKIVKLLLRQPRVSINDQSQDGWTVLMAAVVCGQLGVVQLLLELEANVDTRNNEGQTALSLAQTFNHESSIEKLLLSKLDSKQ